MRYAVLILALLPLLAFAQEAPPPKEQAPKEQAPKDQAPKPRLDLYGDPLPEGAIARMGTVRMRGEGMSKRTAFSPDGRYVAVSTWRAKECEIWKISTGEVYRRISLGGSEVGDVDFSPDSKILAVGGEDVIRLHDVESGKVLLTIESPDFREGTGSLRVGGVDFLLFAPGGKTVASGSVGEGIRIWDAKTGARVRAFTGKISPASSISFSPDGAVLAGGCNDGTIRLWDAATGKEKLVIQVPPRSSNSGIIASGSRRDLGPIAFSPDGKIIGVASTRSLGDPAIHLWDAESGKEIRSLFAQEDGTLALAFSPDGKRLATGGISQSVRIWDTTSWKFMKQVAAASSDRLYFYEDGKRLATVNDTSGAIRVVDVESGKRSPDIPAHDASVMCIDVSRDGRWIASGAEDGSLLVWEAASSRSLVWLAGHFGRVRALQLSPDGQTLASWGDDGTLRFWDLGTGKEIQGFYGHPLWPGRIAVERKRLDESKEEGIPVELVGWVCSTSFAPDGESVALGTGEGLVWIWKIGSPRARLGSSGHAGPVRGLRFSQQGNKLTSFAVDAAIRTWNVTTSREASLIQAHGEGLTCASFSPDGRLLAYGGEDGMIHVWELASARELHHWKEGEWGLRSIKFSPDGRRIVSRGKDPRGEDGGTVIGEYARFRIWEVATAREVFSLPAYSRWTSSNMDDKGVPDSVSFSRDGRYLASGGFDKSVRVWDVAAGKEVRQFRGHGRFINSVCFSPGGDTVVSGGGDTTLLLWKLQLPRPQSPIPGKVSASDLQGIWEDLAGEDTARAQQAVDRLVHAGDAALEFLRQQLPPTQDEILDNVPDLIARMDHDEFSEREKAEEAIRDLGEKAAPTLREAAKVTPEPEIRSRIRRLLAELAPPFTRYPSDQLRKLRAVQALEGMDTGSARSFLEVLASGPAWSLQTREAKAALERLEGREQK